MPDKCPILLECDSGFHIDTDGCPDVMITFPGTSAKISRQSRKVLDDLVSEIGRLKGRLKLLRIVGHGASTARPSLARKRAAAVRTFLIQRNVDPRLLQIKTVLSNRPGEYVTFEPDC